MKKQTPSRSKRSTSVKPAAPSAPAKRVGTARRAPAHQAAPESRRGRLQKLLFESIARMDEEGLVFLLRQAHILSSNASAERINREIEAYERARGPHRSPGAPDRPRSRCRPTESPTSSPSAARARR